MIYIVYGPPLSGKSTWVKNNKSKNSLIFDYDYLMSALSGLELYNWNLNLNYLINKLAYKILNEMINNKKIENCFLIVTNINIFIMVKLLFKNYKIIKMMTSKEDCLKRLEQDERENYNIFEREINDWFIMDNKNFLIDKKKVVEIKN